MQRKIAPMVALGTVERSRAEEAARPAIVEMGPFFSALAALTAEPRFDVAMHLALRAIVEVVGAECGCVLLLDRGGRNLTCHACVGAAEGLGAIIVGSQWRLSGTLAEAYLPWRTPIMVEDFSRFLVCEAKVDLSGSPVLILPVRGRSRAIGLVAVRNPRMPALGAEERGTYAALAAMVSLIVERDAAFAELENTSAVNERKRIARDLHDGLGQRLASISIVLGAGEKLLENDLQRAREEIRTARSMLKNALEEVRRIVHDLRPSQLEGRNLAESLAECVREFNDTGQERTRLEVRGRRRRLPPEVENGLFRVAQEGLQNARRHACARHVRLWLEFAEGQVTLGIVDDGVGFDINEAGGRFQTGSSFGLQGMRERVELLHGQLEIESVPGRGTHIEARAPA